MKTGMLSAVLLLLPVSVFAGVNTKNGNFSISFTDILLESKGHELHLTRTYNSKASEVGWFGFGWGTPFEARLLVMPEGSVVVREHGTGSFSHYAPADTNNLQAGVDRIVAAAVEREGLDTAAAKKLHQQLMADEELRRAGVKKYGITTQLPVGASVPSSECSDSAVTRIRDEYQRTSCAHNYLGIMYIDYFDLAGRLIRKEKGDYKLTIHYEGKYPDRIEDTLGQKIFLEWTPKGRIAEARKEKDEQVIKYTYDERENLVLANVIGGTFNRYTYDDRHNMTRIGYLDNTHMEMQYDKNSLVTAVTEQDGSKAIYAYRTDPNNPTSHYWTTTTRTSTTGDQTSWEEEFFLTANAFGVEQMASKTMTKDNQKQGVEYDERGRIKAVKEGNGVFAEYFYHPTLDKVRVVVTNERSTAFTYDKAGYLVRAYNTNDQLVKLSYDGNKRISRIEESTRSGKKQRVLTFNYNDLGKPTTIKLLGKGEINVEYDQQGEISKVDSKQGSKMAIEVTQAFQTILDVVKVAGVDLSM